MKIVTVIPLAKSIFKEDLTYFTAKEIENGSIVEIPMRNKKILGIAVTSEDVQETKTDIKKMSFNLRKILSVKEHSFFSDKFLSAGVEVAEYFATQKGTALLNLIPALYREKYDKIAEFKKNTPPSKNTEKNLVKKIKPEKLLFQANIEDRLAYYKTLIRTSFTEQKSIFIVLPSENDVDIFQDTLSKGIENFVLVVHGGLTDKKIIEETKKILSTSHPLLILGTPQFLSIPREDIGTIVLEHESASSYKTFARPYLDLRIFVELLAEKICAKLILSDSLLRLETIGRQEEYGDVHSKTFRLNFKGNIEINNPNQKIEGADKKFQIISVENLKEIGSALDKKQNVFIFSLRKGLATLTVCKDCGEQVVCDHCSSPVVLYLSKDGQKRMFVCNKCGTEKDPFMTCPKCSSWNLVSLGIGTDTVEEDIKKNFPDKKIFKLDKESAKTSAGAQKIIKDFSAYGRSPEGRQNSAGAVLIGTEMAFFYLKEPVPLSIIASFDSLWSIPNFKMSEKILHIIFSTLAITENKLIIQTKNTDDPLLLAVQNENLLSFVRNELEARKALHYPPFARFIKISHLGNKEETLKARKYLAELFKEYNPEIFSGFVAKLKNKYSTNALLKLEPHKWSLPELSKGGSIDQNLLAKLSSLPPIFSINVDPEDLL